MAFFSKKSCDICGKKTGMLGSRKLDDGNMCKECTKGLSPYFSDRKRSTVADIKEQLAYREENKLAVEKFNVTRTLGNTTKVLLDEDAQKFIVATNRYWKDENPDVLDFSQVTGCHLEIDERQEEIMRKDREGKQISYNPPKFVHNFDFWINIHVNHPYFEKIRFRLNNSSVRVEPPAGRVLRRGGDDIGRNSGEYRQYEMMGEDIKEALTQVREGVRENIEAANAPKTAQTCPLCGATTIPDEQGRCEFCGGAVS